MILEVPDPGSEYFSFPDRLTGSGFTEKCAVLILLLRTSVIM
jgi:hypothetical protein